MTDRDAYDVLQVHPAAHDLVIQAAYRTLASLCHPDRDPSAAATRRMAELNIAYAQVRSRDLRDLYDHRRRLQQTRPATVVVSQPQSQTSAAPARSDLVNFGRYDGWTITQLARHDPDYLRWLGRHSSGIRYRTQIEAALAAVTSRPPATPTQRR